MAKYRTLVVGVGSIGERHLRCFQATGRADVSFVEVNPTLRGVIAERYKAPAFDSLDAALRDKFEIGVVCTPAQLHIPMSTQMVRAGLHLLIEKPLSTSTDGIDALKAEVARSGKTVAVAYTYRSFPALAAMREAIHSGRFGTPLEFTAVGGQYFPHYRPAYREIYYKDRKTGGGAIQDALTHFLNAAEWLVGPIDRVQGDCAHQRLEGVTVEDTVHVITRHGPVMGSFIMNQHQAVSEVTFTVVCTKGVVRFEGHNSRWRWTTQPEEPWHDEEFGKPERDSFYINQAKAFMDAVEGKRPVLCSIDEGLQTLKVNLAVLQAADNPAWKKV